MTQTKKRRATVSVALTTLFLDYVYKIGIDPHDLCEPAGIELTDLKDMNTRIDAKNFGALWAAASQKAADPHFGLHCSEHVARHYRGGHILFSVMLNCPDVGQAMVKFFQFHDLMNDVVKPKMEIAGKHFCITWDLISPIFQLDRHICEALLAIYVFILRHLTQNRFKSQEIRFTHPQPPDTFVHQTLFQAPLSFNQPRNELVADTRYLHAPLFWANPELLDTLEQFAQTQMQKLYQSDTWSYRTVGMINRQMAKGQKISLDRIAKELGMSTRNLQLKLKKENCAFKALFDDVRKTVAFEYLKRKDVNIVDVAFLLGFSEQSAFNHAFKRWTGMTPWAYVKTI